MKTGMVSVENEPIAKKYIDEKTENKKNPLKFVDLFNYSQLIRNNKLFKSLSYFFAWGFINIIFII